MDAACRARRAGRLAGGDEPVVRHLRARAALDAGARLHRGRRRRRRPRRSRCAARPARGASRSTSACSTSRATRARRRGRQVPPAARRREVRRPQRLRRGLDAGAALPRVRRAVSRTRRSPAPRSRPSPSACRSAPAAWCCRCTTRCASPRSGRWSTTCPKGRVGISFASGWQPNDFVLRPENFADSKNVMLRDIDDGAAAVARRGGRVSRAANGKPVEVRILPRPVQRGAAGLGHGGRQPRDLRRRGPDRRQRADAPARADRRGAGRQARRLPRGVARTPATPARATSR